VHRRDLLALLADYRVEDERDAARCARLRAFVAGHERCFERDLAVGHVTGAAWILDATGSRVLLTHHRKLDRWLQLGGHCDGDPDTRRVAWREAREESGLRSLRLLDAGIYDVDVHAIPARGDEPKHDHYDVRFLFEADEHEPLVVSDESYALEWVAMERLGELGVDESVLRMARKLRALRSRRGP
jgi:ADP-ribose pyrophosphatase YjhB (NUDIX family)